LTAIFEPYIRGEEALMMNGRLKFSTVLLKTVWKSIVAKSKTEEKGGLMHFAQVVCNFLAADRKFCARIFLIPVSRWFEFYFDGDRFGIDVVPLAVRLPTLCYNLD